VNIKVVGLGGIGTCLAPVLCRFLCFERPESTVTFIDGDEYMADNRRRQTFAHFGNKAEVTAEAMQRLFPELCFRAVAEYVRVDNQSALIYNADTVFVCVDNHTTRKLVSDHAGNLSDIAIFSGGNDWTSGAVQIYIRKGGDNQTLPLANQFHPEIEKPKDFHPEGLGCEALQPEAPQLVFANNTAATIMLNAFYAHLQESVMPDEIYFDLLTGSVRAVNRRESLR